MASSIDAGTESPMRHDDANRMQYHGISETRLARLTDCSASTKKSFACLVRKRYDQNGMLTSVKRLHLLVDIGLDELGWSAESARKIVRPDQGFLCGLKATVAGLKKCGPGDRRGPFVSLPVKSASFPFIFLC